ncbi:MULTISPECIES: DUF6705 family protein [unclassified Flavobacterium]|uniref:DUF6705 family protein n=1 Tax=unclassified Flavobacterium TaxID=196869 RepID=UPI000964FFF2|nr:MULTISPECIES: DUF6705 family protein [unclassified Flavobacterium]MBN9282802.1 hypothetical protein [Flavobacterium sp.]OJV68362.1 MAG: hypothetical protein BGO42_04015 [Flavobacterium sp. 40-81]
MKKIVYLFLLMFIATFSYSQQEKIEEIKNFRNQYFTKNTRLTYYFKDVNNYFAPFIGTWIYQNGNQTFVINFWKETKNAYLNETPKYYIDELRGHYKLVQNYGQSNEQLIYTSQINIGNSITPWPTIVTANQPIELYKMGGFVYDVTGIVNPAYPLGVRGELEMIINPANPNTAQWKVKLPPGIRLSDQPSTFTIPTNITLTKVNQ